MYRTALVVALTLLGACSTDAWGQRLDAGYPAAPTFVFEGTLDERVAKVTERIDGYVGQYSLQEDRANLDDVLAQNPGKASALVARARLEMLVGQGYSGGKVFLDKAIASEPDYADAYVLMGHALANLGDLDGAQKSLDKAQALGSTSPWVRLNQATVEKASKRPYAAMALYEQVANDTTVRARERALASHLLAVEVTRRGDWKKGVALMELSTSLMPLGAWAYGNFASTLLMAERPHEGVEYARRALAVMKYGNGEDILAAGLFLLVLENYYDNSGKLTPEATVWLKEAVSYLPDREEALDVVRQYRRDDASLGVLAHLLAKTAQ